MAALVRSGNELRGTVVGAFAVEMVLKFVPPLLHDADGWQRRGVAQRAESTPQHILGQLVDQRDVFFAAQAFMEAVEHLFQPGGAFAAGNAPAAGLVSV